MDKKEKEKDKRERDIEREKNKEKDKEKEKEKDKDRGKDKDKERERERDKDKERDKNKEKDQGKDKEKDQKKSKKHRNSRSRSRSRSKSNYRHKNRSKSTSPREFGRRNKKPNFKEVEIGRIYDGRVTKVHDYGCFVLLENFMPKKEGLVHISNIRDKRITNAFEAVQRNQNVKIKVIAIAGSKISLSMKEVDQETGDEIQKRPKNRQNNVIFSIFINE